jgi:Cu(I)-responsive transcriptional regulator
MLSIGEVAKRTGIKVPTIRFYETEGLIGPPRRTESGRRIYDLREVQRLSFIRHARALGFELDDIKSLLDLSDHPDRSCEDADRIARRHLGEVEIRIAQLQALRRELSRVVTSCAGGKTSHCKVIETLADHAHCQADHSAPAPPTKKGAVLPAARK